MIHSTARTEKPITMILYGWRCSCGAEERPKYASHEDADRARERHEAREADR